MSDQDTQTSEREALEAAERHFPELSAGPAENQSPQSSPGGEGEEQGEPASWADYTSDEDREFLLAEAERLNSTTETLPATRKAENQCSEPAPQPRHGVDDGLESADGSEGRNAFETQHPLTSEEAPIPGPILVPGTVTQSQEDSDSGNEMEGVEEGTVETVEEYSEQLQATQIPPEDFDGGNEMEGVEEGTVENAEEYLEQLQATQPLQFIWPWPHNPTWYHILDTDYHQELSSAWQHREKARLGVQGQSKMRREAAREQKAELGEHLTDENQSLRNRSSSRTVASTGYHVGPSPLANSVQPEDVVEPVQPQHVAVRRRRRRVSSVSSSGSNYSRENDENASNNFEGVEATADVPLQRPIARRVESTGSFVDQRELERPATALGTHHEDGSIARVSDWLSTFQAIPPSGEANDRFNPQVSDEEADRKGDCNIAEHYRLEELLYQSRERVKDLNAFIDICQGRIENFETELKASQTENIEFRRTVGTMSGEVERKNERIKELEREVETVQNSEANAGRGPDARQSTPEVSQEEFLALKRRLAVLAEKVSDSANGANLQDVVSRLESLAEQENKQAGLNPDAETKRSWMEQTELKKTKGAIADRNKAIQAMSSELAQSHNALQERGEEMQGLKGTIAQQADEMQKRDEEINTLKTKEEQKTRELEVKDNTMAQKDKKIQELEAALSEQASEPKAKTEELVENLRETIAAREAQIDELQVDLENLRESNVAMAETPPREGSAEPLPSQSDIIEELKVTLLAKDMEIERLQGQLKKARRSEQVVLSEDAKERARQKYEQIAGYLGPGGKWVVPPVYTAEEIEQMAQARDWELAQLIEETKRNRRERNRKIRALCPDIDL